jgi:alpha-1,2-mannosyltransferase
LNSPATGRPGQIDSHGSRRDRWKIFGLLLWLVTLLVVAVLVARDPAARSVTPTFHLAVRRWWAGQPLYSDPRGFHYLPQFVLLFAPFQALPAPLGDILWRALSVGAVLGGLSAFLRRAMPPDPGRFFFFACLLALGPCLGAVRNGQTNLVFGGLLVVLAVLLADQGWRRAALCLVALCAIKPFGVVFVLLAPFVYRRLVRPLALGLVVFVLAPFLFAPAAYVLAQYRGAVEHIAALTGTTENRFADLAGLLRAAGVAAPAAALTGIRAAAALATLGVWMVIGPRAREPWRALGLAVLGGIYLMLFNPMTEKNTYAVIAPALAVTAVWLLSAKPPGAPGRVLGFALVSIAAFPEIFWRVDSDFGLWWDPLMMIASCAAIGWELRRRGYFSRTPASRGAPVT